MRKKIGDWSSTTSLETKSRKPGIIIGACIIVFGLILAGVMLLNQKDEAGYQSGDVNKFVDQSGPTSVQPLKDDTQAQPSAEVLQQVEAFAGDYMKTLKELDPREPILGIYGVNVPLPADIQSTYGPESVSIATTGLRTIEQVWGQFDSSGAHQDNANLSVLYANVNGFLHGNAYNMFAKATGELPGKVEDSDCFLYALGGYQKDGKLACTGQSVTDGQWYMQVNEPTIDWAGDASMGTVKMTFIRQLFIPTGDNQTLVASTPIVLYMDRAGENDNEDWVVVNIDWGDTVSSIVDGTYETLLGLGS